MPRHIHVVGVAGVGMSALAQALLAEGYDVSGSDRYLDHGQDLEVLRRLELAGVRLVPQDGSAVDPSSSGVVVSTAIEADNPDVAAAQRHGVEIVHRADMLARLARGKECIAVTGTSGKTTVTGMIGCILEQAGRDPTVVNGGVVLDWAQDGRVGNFRRGGSGLWVIEADESDRSLLRFAPEWAVITNVSKDHFELNEVVELFRTFVAQVKRTVAGGAGVGEALGIVVEEPRGSVRRSGAGWEAELGGATCRVPLLGRHNAENALLALSACGLLGVEPEEAARSLERFKGIHRRLEIAGRGQGVVVVDDYAHNPAKIAASWTAVAEGARRVLGFWRPHGYGPLALMKAELADAFAAVCRPGDSLFILPVYYAGGTASSSVTSQDLVELLSGRGVEASCVKDYEELQEKILACAGEGDAVLGMGARDPMLPEFARRVVAALRAC
jgi:UDP-N-acetylmuramate--alanine ligase